MACRLGRRFIALIAAYAFALNALLAPIAMTALAASTPWTDICSSTDSSRFPAGDKLPIQHGALCPLSGTCSVPGCGAIAPANESRDGATLGLPGVEPLIYPARWNDRVAVPHDFSRQFARAPPAA
jgi:hypothetical protein